MTHKTIVIFCAFFLIVAGHASCQEVNDISSRQKLQLAERYYSQGKQFIQQGDFARADQEFKKAQQALETAEVKASEPVPVETAQPLPVEDWATVQKNKPQELIAYLLRAIERDPGNPDLYYNLAVQYIKSERFKEAAEALKQVIKVNPQDKDAYYNLGVLYGDYLSDKKKARSYYSYYLKFSIPPDEATEIKNWMRQLNENKKDW